MQDIFLGEILGAVALTCDHSSLKPTLRVEPIKVFAEGVESKDGQTVIDKNHGKLVKILEKIDTAAYHDLYANQLGNTKQSAVLGSYDDQRRKWSTPPNYPNFVPGNGLNILFSLFFLFFLFWQYSVEK